MLFNMCSIESYLYASVSASATMEQPGCWIEESGRRTSRRKQRYIIYFQDVNITTLNDRLVCNWYQKPTSSGRFLNYASHHPINQKIGVILGLLDRAFLLSHPMHHQENINKVIDMLSCNGYPLHLIHKTLQKRLKNLIHRTTRIKINNNRTQHNVGQDKKFFVLPYVEKYSNMIKRVLNNHNYIPAYIGDNKLNFIRPHKDKLPKDSQNAVMYRIGCRDCMASYVGQTKRQLKTRIDEHINQLTRVNTKNYSVVSLHRLDGHEFDWRNVKILDKESSFLKRSISEMIHIKTEKNAINLQEDTNNLNNIYTPIIQHFSRSK